MICITFMLVKPISDPSCPFVGRDCHPGKDCLHQDRNASLQIKAITQDNYVFICSDPAVKQATFPAEHNNPFICHPSSCCMNS